MRTFNFSRHNVLLFTEDGSLDIPDTGQCRAGYTLKRIRGTIEARIGYVERETKKDIWVHDNLPSLERQALEAHIEKLFEEDEALDLNNVREVAEGFT
jgi:hypothetical protein